MHIFIYRKKSFSIQRFLYSHFLILISYITCISSFGVVGLLIKGRQQKFAREIQHPKFVQDIYGPLPPPLF